MTRTVFAAMPLLLAFAADAQAQDCSTTTRNDFINYSYVPSRPFSLKNGFLSVLANDIVADDEHDRDTATRSVALPAGTGATSASVTYNVIDGLADADAWLFGYAEAGIELNMTAKNSAGATLCTAREELYIARWNETGTPTLGTRSLSCGFSGATGSVSVSLEAHAWVTVGGAAGGEARTSVQIVNVGAFSCAPSCASHCGGSSSFGGASCFCDAACSSFGDCCDDVAPECEPDSCWNQCGGSAPSGACWCDTACSSFGDCCEDKVDSCG
ncbi:MAG: hypothetical protein R3F59_06075 [Myxococcota bacterium]